MTYVTDWSAVSEDRYAAAQSAELDFWLGRGSELLGLRAKYYFYAGFYAWAKRHDVLNPFRISGRKPQNFQLTGDDVEGAAILDVGCGPASVTLSLVHAARVSVVDPLMDMFREVQPFGWEYFERVETSGAESLPFDDATFDFVYCSNVLDHTRDADAVLIEIARVLRPGGQLLFGCDVRPRGTGGGNAHPYSWTLAELEARVLSTFELVNPAALVDSARDVVAREDGADRHLHWIARLRPSAAR